MAYASKLGRARISARSPQAAAVCDRCGFVYNHCDLQWQYDWRGAALQNLRILVCRHCLDTPQQQLRAAVLSADPVPIINARPQDYVDAEAGSYTGLPYGQPVGLQQAAIPPLNDTVTYGVALSLLSVTANGTTTVAVTCGTPHGLATNAQVSVIGLARTTACGFFSVVVTTATAFTYQTFSAILSGALLMPTTRMVTVLVGLPYGVVTIPQIGP